MNKDYEANNKWYCPDCKQVVTLPSNSYKSYAFLRYGKTTKGR